MPAPRSLDEQITEQFYRWEKRGRGWHVFPFPVPIEPPFRPFFGHYVTAPPTQDDARSQTFLGSFLERLRGERPPPQPNETIFPDELDEEPAPAPLISPGRHVEIAI